jgi:hypothetical protein
MLDKPSRFDDPQLESLLPDVTVDRRGFLLPARSARSR